MPKFNEYPNNTNVLSWTETVLLYKDWEVRQESLNDIIALQDLYWPRTSREPSFTGTGGTVWSYNERVGKYKLIWKTCTVYIRLRADKNTLSWPIRVELPFQENNAYQCVFVTLANFSSSTKYHQWEIFNRNLTIQNLASDNSYNRSDMWSNVMLKATFTYEIL